MTEATVTLPAAPATGEPGSPRSVPLSILWAILTLGIYTFVWVYRTQDELQRYSGRGLGGPVGLAVYVLTVIVGYFAVVVTGVLIASEVQELYRRDGRTPPFSGLWGLWLLLPIVGAFVWFIPVQQALNDYWDTKAGPRPEPRSTDGAA